MRGCGDACELDGFESLAVDVLLLVNITNDNDLLTGRRQVRCIVQHELAVPGEKMWYAIFGGNGKGQRRQTRFRRARIRQQLEFAGDFAGYTVDLISHR